LFVAADRTGHLTAQDLELAAVSAYLIGHEADFQRYYERAHHDYLRDAEQRRAARCGFWLGLLLLLRGETAQANGWIARAQRLIEGQDCVEHGYLLLPAAELHLGQHESSAALAIATSAAEVGERFRDPDLTTCARHQQGRALIQHGAVARGLKLLDETMIAVSGGELSPMMTGLMYCSVIDACQQVFALGRAREWTSVMDRWCAQQPELVAFRGICLIHRAAVLQFRGAWEEAMNEARSAHGRFVEVEARMLPAVARYREGEIHRLRGEIDTAEEAYRYASRLGLEPQPGLALLRLAQGRVDAADAAIRRVLRAAADPLDRARLLPAYVEITLASRAIPDARLASSELQEIAHAFPSDVLQAMAAQAHGAVELADGHTQSALSLLRHAFELWQQIEAPYETARVRLLIALACRELGDIDSASLEFDAARALFQQLGATPDVAHLDTLRRVEAQTHRIILTPREAQVLRQIAAGKTNKEIAAALAVSERTVDRHVSNILTKLGVPSRAAATASALQQKLL
jgi:DNA-binding NarL/FixJ family response regulator